MINWKAVIILLYVLIGGTTIGWSIEYFHKKKYFLGGVYTMCTIINIMYLVQFVFKL
jgi:hypothetical protein